MEQALRRGERLVIAIAGGLKMENGFVNDHDRDESRSVRGPATCRDVVVRTISSRAARKAKARIADVRGGPWWRRRRSTTSPGMVGSETYRAATSDLRLRHPIAMIGATEPVGLQRILT